MKNSYTLPLLCIAGLSLISEGVQAADEDVFLGQIRTPMEQTMGHGQSALWTMQHLATQYHSVQPTPAMQAAAKAQSEGRFLEALIRLDEAEKTGQASEDAKVEMNLLRASFLLQANQPQQATGMLTPLLTNTQHAADAYALTAMAHLEQGRTQQALEAAQHAQGMRDGISQRLVLSYVLQAMGRLAEARDVMHGFNAHAPQHAIALTREAELALTLGQTQTARVLVAEAQGMDTHPYVIAVSGLVYLVDGRAGEAKAAFETALQSDPKDAKALLGLGLAEIKLGNFQTGQKKLQAANEADPGNALILTYLGRSQQQLGQIEAARASWRSAQQADPKDPAPWLYQAQAELQANRPLAARESVRQAQARAAYRSVYRGQVLLNEDEQLLQANLAEIQRQLGMESLAFQTLNSSTGEKNSANLRNQADVLQGQRFGESARRSLLLQSQFNDRPGNLPAALDIYGDGAGQTGASVPQHGAVNSLSAQQASYNNFDELFSRRTTLEADATSGSKSSNGEQIRLAALGAGSDALGLSIAQNQFKTDGFAPFENLDNHVWQAAVQWRPTLSTQAFVSQQSFNSQRGETYFPAFTAFGYFAAIQDNSRVTRAGVRQTVTDNSELRSVLSFQQTGQVNNDTLISDSTIAFSQSGSGSAHSEELQYRRWGAAYATQWGVQNYSGHTIYWDTPSGIQFSDESLTGQQLYAAWQQALNPYWRMDAGLGYGQIDKQDNVRSGNSTYLAHWLPSLGVAYTPEPGTHVRLAAWQGMGIPAVGDATLAPVTLAGIVLTRPDDNLKWVRAVHLNADRQLSPSWLLDAQAQRRKTDLPVPQDLVWQQVDGSRLALHWQPEGQPWSASVAYDYERILNDPKSFVLDSVDGQILRQQQVGVRWFASTRWTANLLLSHNQVAGSQQSLDSITYDRIVLPYRSSFNQVDADLSWKFNGARGLLIAGVRNATDMRLHYTDVDKLNPRFSNGRLLYARLKFAW